MMLQTKSRLGLAGNQVQTARDGTHGGAYPIRLYDTPKSAKRQAPIPPPHLTEQERKLWAAAEAARGNGDRQKFWDLRRELLLTQASRY